MTLSEDASRVLRRLVEDALHSDPVGVFILALLLLGMSTKRVTTLPEDDVRWLLEEVDRCPDEKCIEKTVKELLTKLKYRKRASAK